jgi:transposase
MMPQSIPPANAGLRVLGADVAKRSVVFHDALTGRGWTTPNTPEALTHALTAFADYDWLICETTGGYERALLDAATALGLAACRADAARVKAFIASHGGRAKTDALDAAWLARYGQERAAGLVPWRACAPERQALADFFRHRQDLLALRVQARNRRSAPGADLLAELLDAHIDFLTTQIRSLDARIRTLLDASRTLTLAEQVLRSIEGVGPVAAHALLALMPELGRLSPKTAASLAGLAPHPRDSGQTRAHRRMRGGRAGLKPILFMAALSAARHHPTLSLAYQRLIQLGKAKRLALAAIARRLVVIANAKLRDAHIHAI